ncbi:50S ribosomal protein L18 [Candidatus Pacearchaeota archaeon CG10_big_fil_rev_8_21_14_0_10_32_42]|nr:MAG: 50S ribosomal protein L18 [Candidatus Pacearchaeota archaeon CG10_big_fil_rev_8_21_14_0_10_32_42]
MKTLKRRKKEGKTDYLKRMKLLKSEKPRLVFRKTNSYVISQYVESESAQDKVIFGINSKMLLNHGWPENLKGSLKSIPASYLTGYLTAKKIQKDKLESPIVDLGMQRIIEKTRIFAFIKGLIDGGIEIECPKEKFPEEERLKGKNAKEDISKTVLEVKSKIDKL